MHFTHIHWYTNFNLKKKKWPNACIGCEFAILTALCSWSIFFIRFGCCCFQLIQLKMTFCSALLWKRVRDEWLKLVHLQLRKWMITKLMSWSCLLFGIWCEEFHILNMCKAYENENCNRLALVCYCFSFSFFLFLWEVWVHFLHFLMQLHVETNAGTYVDVPIFC